MRIVPTLAKELRTRRDQRIQALEDEAKRLTGKLDDQDAGQRYRGRKLSDGGATARFYQAVCEAKLASIIKVDLTADVFSYTIDQRALKRARLLDGKLILVSNVPDLDRHHIGQADTKHSPISNVVFACSNRRSRLHRSFIVCRIGSMPMR